MKKPLTKEEFLDRKNSKIHKELLAVFESKSNNDAISRWFRQFKKDNPKLGLCRFMGRSKTRLNITYNYQEVFINMCEILKSGELVVKYENKLPKEQRKIIDDFSEKGFSIIKGKKIYLKDVGHLDIKEIL